MWRMFTSINDLEISEHGIKHVKDTMNTTEHNHTIDVISLMIGFVYFGKFSI